MLDSQKSNVVIAHTSKQLLHVHRIHQIDQYHRRAENMNKFEQRRISLPIQRSQSTQFRSLGIHTWKERFENHINLDSYMLALDHAPESVVGRVEFEEIPADE
uniref:Uncharacterized protein n=1 Tax=Caenorhabditis japonica TaxID=281687 RepID=A0A8R1EPF6_CAEJA